MIVLGYEIQSLVIIISITDAEFGLTIAAIPITIAILLFCAWSVRHENKPGMGLTIFCFFGGLAYFLFKVTILCFTLRILACPDVSTLTSMEVHTCAATLDYVR